MIMINLRTKRRRKFIIIRYCIIVQYTVLTKLTLKQRRHASSVYDVCTVCILSVVYVYHYINHVYFQEREDNSSGSLPSGKQPIILAKPDRDKDFDRSDGRSQSDGPGGSSTKTAPQTTFILKTRDSESRAVSPSQKAPVVLRYCFHSIILCYMHED